MCKCVIYRRKLKDTLYRPTSAIGTVLVAVGEVLPALLVLQLGVLMGGEEVLVGGVCVAVFRKNWVQLLM